MARASNLDAEIAGGALYLAMAKQKLDGAQIAGANKLGENLAIRRTRPEQVRRYAYLYVGVAARNRQNLLRPSSLLRPVATGRVPITTPDIRSGSPFRIYWGTDHTRVCRESASCPHCRQKRT